jgi:hypothetical protein
MAGIARHDRNHPWASDLCFTVDRHFHFSFHYFIDLFLRMKVFVNRRAALEVVMGKGHVRRMEVTSMPAGQALDDLELAGVDKGHADLRGENRSAERLEGDPITQQPSMRRQ